VEREDFFQHAIDYGLDSAADEPRAPVHDASEEHEPLAEKQPKAWYHQLPATGGVYWLTDEADRFIQLASAGNLRRALRLRLSPQQAQPEKPTTEPESTDTVANRKPDLAQIVRRIRWRSAYSMFEMTWDYYRIAKVLMPNDYLENVAFGPAWFVHVDPSAAVPRFMAGKLLRSPPGVDLGPFATQADATRFIQSLEDAFDLCRYYSILEQTPHGQTCAYFEMGRCPAPCNGSIPMSQYRDMLGQSLAFASGQQDKVCEQWTAQMYAAAQAQAFERASVLKRRLEVVRELKHHKAYRLVQPLEHFDYLIVHRGGGTTRIKPFFVQAGHIRTGQTVRLREIDRVAEEWIAEVRSRDDATAHFSAAGDRAKISEHIGLVSHFLFKRETPGLFLNASELTEPAQLIQQIRRRFERVKDGPEETSLRSDANGTN